MPHTNNEYCSFESLRMRWPPAETTPQRATHRQSIFIQSLDEASSPSNKWRRPARKSIITLTQAASDAAAEEHATTETFELPLSLSEIRDVLTREKQVFSKAFKRRDSILLTISVLFSLSFIAVGILCSVEEMHVCAHPWLLYAVNGFLPSFLVGGPYTLIVVFVGVSKWGRRLIAGRYTPILYAVTVTLVRVAVQALLCNMSYVWILVDCK